MATPAHILIHNENLGIPHKKATANDKAKTFKTAAKKGGLGSRKALNDITNKSTFRPEASSRKKNIPKEEFNFAGEAFLHDHKKCVDSQKKPYDSRFILDLILPGHDEVFPVEHSPTEKTKLDLDSPHWEPEPELSDWCKALSPKASPPASPIRWDSPPGSPFALQLKPVEFVLKPENAV